MPQFIRESSQKGQQDVNEPIEDLPHSTAPSRCFVGVQKGASCFEINVTAVMQWFGKQMISLIPSNKLDSSLFALKSQEFQVPEQNKMLSSELMGLVCVNEGMRSDTL